jgi:SIR2-like domain
LPNTLEDDKWKLLLERIKDGKCTPFLGAGACSGKVPLGSTIAHDWAEKYEYPMEDCSDLARVAQFLAVTKDPMFPKDLISKQFKNTEPPDFTKPNEPHGLLAELPLPVYITTNYDDFMVKALKSRGKKPRRELCRWNSYTQNHLPRSIFKSRFNPDKDNPVVFHLHGYTEELESLVLTEDDYLDFLKKISEDQDLIPQRIQRAFAGASLLFLGYSLADWNFKVIFRSLFSYMERNIVRSHVSVQLMPQVSETRKKKVQEYLDNYFREKNIHIFWGDVFDFVDELRRRWEAYKRGN